MMHRFGSAAGISNGTIFMAKNNSKISCPVFAWKMFVNFTVGSLFIV